MTEPSLAREVQQRRRPAAASAPPAAAARVRRLHEAALKNAQGPEPKPALRMIDSLPDKRTAA
jgi:hypothetical protein